MPQLGEAMVLLLMVCSAAEQSAQFKTRLSYQGKKPLMKYSSSIRNDKLEI